MPHDRICVVTVTRARDEAEEALMAATLTSLTARHLPVIASDGGSSPAFLASLSRLPHLTWARSDEAGLVGQVKASVRAALGTAADYLLYLESDKAQFVNGPLPHFIASAHPQEGVGVVLAARSPASFATFPEFQRRTEAAFNDVAAAVIGVSTDYLYGPFLMPRALAVHVQEAGPDLGWGWRPFIFASARRLGLPVRSVEGDYPCPPGQMHENAKDRRHRLRQLGENVQGLVRALALDGGNHP